MGNRNSFLEKIRPLMVWGVGDLYFILSVTVTIIFGVLSSDLQNQLHLTEAQLGLASFAFFLSYGTTQLLIGGLIDSWGPRIVLTLFAGAAAFGLFLLSTAQNFTDIIIAQIIIGIGFSPSYVGAIYLASMWFSKERFSLFSGITQMSANIVSASFILVMALAGAVTVNFRDIMYSFALATLVIGALALLIVRTTIKINPEKTSDQKETSLWKNLYNLLHIPQFWLGALYFSTNFSVFLAFSSLWNVPDSLAYGHNLQTASLLSSTLRFGGALGAVISGIIASRIGRCSILTKWNSTGALLLSLILIYGPVYPLPLVFFIFACLGFFFGGTVLGFPLVGQYIPDSLKGTGFGLMTASGYLLSALLQYVTGALLGSPDTMSSPETVYIFKIALTPLVIMLSIGCFCTFWLRDRTK